LCKWCEDTDAVCVCVCALVGGVLFYNVTFRDCEFMCSPPRRDVSKRTLLSSQSSQSSSVVLRRTAEVFFIFYFFFHPSTPSTLPYRADKRRSSGISYYTYMCAHAHTTRVPVIHYNTYAYNTARHIYIYI